MSNLRGICTVLPVQRVVSIIRLSASRNFSLTRFSESRPRAGLLRRQRLGAKHGRHSDGENKHLHLPNAGHLWGTHAKMCKKMCKVAENLWPSGNTFFAKWTGRFPPRPPVQARGQLAAPPRGLQAAHRPGGSAPLPGGAAVGRCSCGTFRPGGRGLPPRGQLRGGLRVHKVPFISCHNPHGFFYG